jgi:glycosyltransferase involved in cell wall biosynthesis
MLVTNEVTYDSRVLKEAGTLSRQGFEVSILGLDRRGDSPPVDEREGFVAFHCREWRFGRWLRNRPEKPLNFLGKALKALRFFLFSLRGNGDIIHAHDLDALPFGFLAARRCRAKLVYDSHELAVEQWVQGAGPGSFTVPITILSRLEGYIACRADAVITVNESIAQELARRYLIAPPLILRNCASHRQEGRRAPSLRNLLGLPLPDRIVIHTGDLNPRGRALKELILALRDLSGIHLVFLGEGPMEKELSELARKEGLESMVHFLKPVLPEDLISTIAEADLAAVTIKPHGSLNNLYSLPNKLFEAIAAGLPVVASDLPEIGQLVRAYQIGVLCHPEDPQDIARAIQEVLLPDRYGTFKENLKQAQRELSWEKESQKLVDLYQRLVKASG